MNTKLVWTIAGGLLGLGIGLLAGHTPIGLVISTAIGAIAAVLIHHTQQRRASREQPPR